MWSRNGTPVEIAPRPLPSRLSATLTSVSRVLRSTAAARAASASPSAPVRGRCLPVLGTFRRGVFRGAFKLDLFAIFQPCATPRMPRASHETDVRQQRSPSLARPARFYLTCTLLSYLSDGLGVTRLLVGFRLAACPPL